MLTSPWLVRSSAVDRDDRHVRFDVRPADARARHFDLLAAFFARPRGRRRRLPPARACRPDLRCACGKGRSRRKCQRAKQGARAEQTKLLHFSILPQENVGRRRDMRPVRSMPNSRLVSAFQVDRAGVHRKFRECSRFATCCARAISLLRNGPANAAASMASASRWRAFRQARCPASHPPSLPSPRWSPAAGSRWRSGRRGAAGGVPPRRRRCSTTMAGSPPCSRPGPAMPLVVGAGRRDQRSRPARRRARARRAAAALDGAVRRERAVPDRGGGRARRAARRSARRAAVSA